MRNAECGKKNATVLFPPSEFYPKWDASAMRNRNARRQRGGSYKAGSWGSSARGQPSHWARARQWRLPTATRRAWYSL